MVKLTQRYEKAVHLLEDVLAQYLYDGQPASARPTTTVNGKPVDAIDYYSTQVSDLRSRIERRSEKATLADYGWALFDCVDCAHDAARVLATKLKQTRSDTQVRISPPLKDIIWSNLAVDKKLRTMRRWFGRGLFTSLMFAWLVPGKHGSQLSSTLEAGQNCGDPTSLTHTSNLHFFFWALFSRSAIIRIRSGRLFTIISRLTYNPS